MAHIGRCNLVVPGRHSTRGLFSQASPKNIFWQNTPQEQQKNKYLWSVNREFRSNLSKSLKSTFCPSELQEALHNRRTTLISGNVYILQRQDCPLRWLNLSSRGSKSNEECSTDFRMSWQSEQHLSRDPVHILWFLPHSQADVVALSLLLLPEHS